MSEPTLAGKLRASLGLTLSGDYARMPGKEKHEADDDEHTESGTFDANDVAPFDSGHMNMLSLMARHQQQPARQQSAPKNSESDSGKAAAKKSRLDSESTAGARDTSETAFGICRTLGASENAFTAARGAKLKLLLQEEPEECAELLRRNVFWPLLASCVEYRDTQTEAVVEILAAIDIVLSHPPSRAVVAAQLLHRDKELVLAGLAQLGGVALAVASQLTEATRNDAFLFVVLSRIAADQLPVTDVHLFAQAVVTVTVSYKDYAKKEKLVALRRYAAVFVLQHKRAIDLLALCKSKGCGWREARADVTARLQAPQEAAVREALSVIWRSGLTASRLQVLEDMLG